MKKILPADLDFNEGYVVNVDKPLGWTSTDVVRRFRSLLGACGYRKIKVGHAGTLDPLATGVLLVCVGRATKRVDELQAGRKRYVADVMLGATTPSFDLEHPVDAVYPWEHITEDMVRGALAALSGERMQTPPLYSAKKIEGQRAYDYARGGAVVEMRGVPVNIYAMELLEWAPPRVTIMVDCSRGTYVRSIARDLGEALGSGAHLVALRRTRSGEYGAEEAFSLDEVVESIRAVKQNRK